jgi:Mor family transcriptional regulator
MNFIINKTKDDSIKLELQSVYILVNEYNSENLEIIQNIMQKVKTVNIVTKELNKYIALEEKMSNEKGIYMSVTNNKRKSLKNAKIIINFDFKNEEIAQYSINRNCIFINCANEKINCVKYFDGIIINNISIDFEEPEEIKKYNIYNEFDKIKIYEDFIFFNIMGEPNFKYLGSNCERLRIAKPICSEIDRKNIKIEDLMGNNGKINQKELVKMKKLLDKC